jgi:GNAT superfamily N-acetyltransferase
MTIPARFVPLRDYPQAAAGLERALEAEWPGWYGPDGPGDAAADLAAFANPGGALPVGVVALDPAGDPVGLATLKPDWIDAFSHLSPWASTGYVDPALRRQGLGAGLLRALETEAHRLGLAHIYCVTATAITLLRREGWTQIAETVHDGASIGIFRRDL